MLEHVEQESGDLNRRQLLQGMVGSAVALAGATTMAEAAQASPAGMAPVALHDLARSVQITIPASVAFDLGTLHTGIAGVMERLGCRTCFSGADCFFRMERELTIRNSDVIATKPIPEVTISLAKEVGGRIDLVKAAVERVFDKLGCPACSSGFDLRFRQEADFLAVGKDLHVQGLGPRF